MFRSIRRQQRQQTQGRRTSIEGLEGRLLFAVFPVTTTADTGPGSLRQAIINANAAPGRDSIEFGIGTGPQTISPASALPNLSGAAGVILTGASQPGYAPGNPQITIDGSGAGPGVFGLNLTGGNNTIIGLVITDFDGNAVQSGATGNDVILGCVITASGSGDGIQIGGPDSRVGGPSLGDRNVITGNAAAGIDLASGADGTVIENNRVGTNAAGTAAAANLTGINITSATDVIVVNNLVSGNGGNGIATLMADGLLVQGNTIGLNAARDAALGNGGGGISMDDTPNARVLDNVISGNTGEGITAGPGSSDLLARGNTIGLNADGDAALGNGSAGIILGGTLRPDVIDNVISANGGPGLLVADNLADAIIQSNLIGVGADGTTDFGNTGAGLRLGGTGPATSSDALVGGATAGLGNTIAFNGGPGIDLPSGSGNAFLGNSIFANDGLGIDLGSDPTPGRTPNDANDPDGGANNLQNFPVLAQAISSAGNSTISGTLNSTPNTAFRIEFFSDTGAANVVEGRTFLGSANATTSASGVASFNAQVVGVVAGRQVTATATNNTTNDTSEFSDPVFGGISGPDIQVSGNGVVITAGDPSPAAADLTQFGSTAVGGTAVSRIFTVTNTGQSNLDLSGGVTIDGGAGQFTVSDQPTATLTPNASTSFEIQFNPASGGNQTATVTVASNDPDENPFSFAIAGQGTTPAPAPEIELIGNGNPIADGDTQPSLDDNTDFSTVTIGDSPVVRSYTITNAGQVALAVGTVTVGGADPTQFSITEQPAGVVQPGASTTFSVQFVPTITNQLGAVISIPSSDGNETPYEFTVRGVGVPGAGAPPTASVLPADQQPAAQLSGASYDFLVRYADEDAVSTSTFDNADITVTGPDNVPISATFVQVQTPGITQVDVRYRITAPGGTLDAADDGAYTVRVNAGQVGDSTGNTVAPGAIGSFTLDLAAARTSLGTFGVVGGRRVRLAIAEPDNTQVTISLTNGTGEVFRTTGGRLDLEMASTAGKLTVTTRGGNGRAEVNDVRVTGSLKSLVARTSDVTGVVLGAGAIDTINLGSTTGATISTPAAIKSLTINGNMASTQVFSGAILGNDGRFGGTAAAADTAFGTGAINKFNVNGTITQSLIAAGLDPIDDVLRNGNGAIVGAAASRLGAIKVRGSVDNATVFAASVYPRRATLGGVRIDPATDPRFDMTP